MMKHIAVIGAGAAGLAALRRIITNPAKFTAVAFEQSNLVGGTWIYTDRTNINEDDSPLHSSMYKNLKTNLPKECMAFQDFPFDEILPSFMMHHDVLRYLNLFADHYRLREFIQFNTSVVKVQPLRKENDVIWEVTSKTKTSDGEDIKTENFDAVMVCNGHYSVPLMPSIEGLDTFTGEVIHSHNYRHPEDYKDKTVLCLGLGASGQDICLDLAPYVKQLYLSSWKPELKSKLPENISQKAAIKSLRGDIAVLANDDECKIDVLLLCTGYEYTFPFLTAGCGVSIKGERVFPVYKHILQPSLPSLTFIGLCKVVCPFPQFDLQVRFALAALEGSMTLPSTDCMLADIDEDYQGRLARGMPHRYAHHLGDAQWQYNDMIADLAGVDRLPPVVNSLYNHVHSLRRSVLTQYKTFNYQLEDSEKFKEITME